MHGDRLRAGTPPWYVIKPTRSTQPCIPPGSLNRVTDLIGRSAGGNVTSVRFHMAREFHVAVKLLAIAISGYLLSSKVLSVRVYPRFV